MGTKSSGKWTHGLSRRSDTRYLYRCLERILQRCNNPNNKAYKDYGGRGIRVCEEWNHPSKFKAFFSHVGHRPTPMHTIERIDNERGYEIGNVRWATRIEQQRNRRCNVLLSVNGEKMCVSEMSEKYGVPSWTIRKRLRCGWPDHLAVTVPVGSVKKGWIKTQ